MRAVATHVPGKMRTAQVPKYLPSSAHYLTTLGPRLSTAVCWPLNEVAVVQPAHCGMKLQVCCSR